MHATDRFKSLASETFRKLGHQAISNSKFVTCKAHCPCASEQAYVKPKLDSTAMPSRHFVTVQMNYIDRTDRGNLHGVDPKISSAPSGCELSIRPDLIMGTRLEAAQSQITALLTRNRAKAARW